MDKELPPDAFVPVPLRWRHVIASDVVLGRDGALWAITDVDHLGTWVAVNGLREYQSQPDPDEVVNVLVPVTERDAVELTREQLGARLIERRTA